jgi:hypothetical protein
VASVIQTQVRCAGCNRRLADLVNEVEAGQILIELKCYAHTRYIRAPLLLRRLMGAGLMSPTPGEKEKPMRLVITVALAVAFAFSTMVAQVEAGKKPGPPKPQPPKCTPVSTPGCS